jgi:hypothetical protein
MEHRRCYQKRGFLSCLEKTTIPKSQGGLGIIDLRDQNTSLLLKYLQKNYNRVNLPWVQLSWKAFYTRPIPPHHSKKSCLFLVVWYHIHFGSLLHDVIMYN